MAEQVKQRMTAEEFLDLPESTDLMELINGEVIVSPTPIPIHQRIIIRLVVLLDNIAAIIGGEVLTAPMTVYLDTGNVVQPDVFWIAPDSQQCFVSGKVVEGAPELVIEVLSPNTAKYDKEDKFRLYEQHGVREYWIVDPAQRQLEVWRLENGRFARFGVFGVADTFIAAVLNGQIISVRAIFER